ncbi:hypothetical protein OVS_03080 [Mycoplasma ovis str. Michigan]|uniref:Uncharacterized protein n=1 Tax=Mycoplasma ovis str. Michigan TaxID=1415773 RepID=A0ABM5P1N2_9MOLU|nr:hypothetical protein OVS_03080 [Mycoplasma ovis str. Michigan]
MKKNNKNKKLCGHRGRHIEDQANTRALKKSSDSENLNSLFSLLS